MSCVRTLLLNHICFNPDTNTDLNPESLPWILTLASYSHLVQAKPDISLLPAVPDKDEGVGHGHQGEEHPQTKVEDEPELGFGQRAQRVPDVEAERKKSGQKGESTGSSFRVRNVGDVRVASQEKAGGASGAIWANFWK